MSERVTRRLPTIVPPAYRIPSRRQPELQLPLHLPVPQEVPTKRDEEDEYVINLN